jgi:hypothetical protein
MQRWVHEVVMAAAMTANHATKISEATLRNNQLSGGDDDNSESDKEGDKGDEGSCNNSKQ